MEINSALVFYCNGKLVTDPAPDPAVTLLTYLREKLRLCGTKLGCGEGGCGACTVMLSRVDRQTGHVEHLAVNACLTPVCAVHGMAVTTVEGIGNTRSRLHPVQERIAKAHGSQCGFCTPGFVMSMYALLRSTGGELSMHDLEVAFQGNLCRCTGYRPIIEGYRTFSREFRCAMGDKCCRLNGGTAPEAETERLFDASSFVPYDPSQDPIFPPQLRLDDTLDRQSLVFRGDRTTWHRPTQLSDLVALKGRHPEAKVVVGNTEIGVEVKFKHLRYPVLLCAHGVRELHEWRPTEDGVRVGASMSLSRLQAALETQIAQQAQHKTAVFRAIVKMLHFFAGKQIRNVASVGGNIMTGSPISDLNPILMAARVRLEVEGVAGGRRFVTFDENFFTGYRRNILNPDDVLVAVHLPFTTERQHFVALKQAKRRDDDIAIVNIAVNVKLSADPQPTIEALDVAFGGMAPTTVLATASCRSVLGRRWDAAMVEQMNRSLVEELPLAEDAPGGMVAYRRSLTLSLFFKCFLQIGSELQLAVEGREASGREEFHTLQHKSTQVFQKNPETREVSGVGQPLIHNSAYKQASGEAVYCDDIPRMDGELYMGLVLSTRAHAKILSVDESKALAMPGVVAFFSAKDLPEKNNMIGPVIHDEEIFRRDLVTSVGQTIGVVIAETQDQAQEAARAVVVQYEDVSPLVVTIEDAINNDSYLPDSGMEIVVGDIEKGFAESDHVVEGNVRMAGQEHFYMETHAAVAYPVDGNEMRVVAASQGPTMLQNQISAALGIPSNKVSVTAKRLGGGFGGKETRSYLVAVPAAIASFKLQRPVRCMFGREEDMVMTGTRHPFKFWYKVGLTKEGDIKSFDTLIHLNAGYSFDMSQFVLEHASVNVLNAYRCPNLRIIGKLCKTNLPSNTAFRGFGAPQAQFMAEHVIRDICRVTGRSYAEIVERNFLRKGEVSFYGQLVEDDNMLRCFRECRENAKVEERQKEVEEFNRENRWRKRGISMVNIQYAIGFGIPFMSQAGALVLIYVDGSVLVSHGGVEIGQGLYVKMLQVAATALGIPVEKCHTSETSTNTVPNTSPTAASVSSDLNGMAVLMACNELNKRLEPIKEKNPKGSWEDWIKAAYMERISLSAVGHHASTNISVSPGGPPCKYSYFTYGSACAEVEIDCLTGDHQVRQVDIIMDLGASLNPAIDIGQIEGAFMQGYGLFTIEEMIYSPTGQIYSRGPGAYKLPSYADIPGALNVMLLAGSKNPRAVYSSKAVGEPPLFAGAAVFFAIKDAIEAARKDEGLEGNFELSSPATAARIRMACQDKMTEKFCNSNQGPSWNVMA